LNKLISKEIGASIAIKPRGRVIDRQNKNEFDGTSIVALRAHE
jgi:hypothetical protein